MSKTIRRTPEASIYRKARRAAGGHSRGVQLRKVTSCPCCQDAPKSIVRRQVKAAERRAWQLEAQEATA